MTANPLKQNSHVHLMGICGTAMASLAGLLQSKGYRVTGSDQSFYPPMSVQLEKLKIPTFQGYAARNLESKPDLVIVGNVITRDNAEAVELMRLKLPYMSLPQAMSQFLIQDRHSIVVAGTHGKTTTTSLAAWATESLGLKPGFLVGGIPKNFNQSFQLPQGSWFVIEGDEYDTAFFDKVPKFIHYRPRSVILTSIEFDHADIYKNLDAVKAAFQRLLELIPSDGHLIYNAEDQNIQSLLHFCKGQKISFATQDSGVRADFIAQDIQPVREGVQFTVKSSAGLDQFTIPMFGEYNALNATAVFALLKTLDLKSDFQKILSTFKGVKRRQELIGEPNQIQVIEDFAHHPTAVAQTIDTFQRRQNSGKLHAVFEPRSATSRRKIFQKDYIQSFLNADFAYITQPFAQEKLPADDRFSTDEVVKSISQQGPAQGIACKDATDVIEQLQRNAKPGDTILIMSNGGFDGIYEKLLKALA